MQVKVQQAPPPTPMPEPTMSAETLAARKAENQRKAELLRAQLLAKRQNTPMKTASQHGTPAKAPMVPQQPAPTPTPTQPSPVPARPTPAPEIKGDVFRFGSDGRVVGKKDRLPSQSSLNLDALIANAKQAAEAKAKEQSAGHTNGHAHEPEPTPTSANNVKPTTAPQPIETPKAPVQRAPVQVHQAPVIAEKAQHPQHLTDVYYTDLAAWLEFTGYHDVEYRNAKLLKHKERKGLEAEAAKIQQQLNRLKREEEAEMLALRSSVAHSTSTPQTAPPLPPTMPSGDAAVFAAVGKDLMNGVKRPHSPTPVERNNKRREEPSTNGFRIRGANESPTSPRDLERRISYPDDRRRSLDATNSRDPSLERRQANYRRDGERPVPRQYDTYDPRGSPRDYPSTRGGAGYRGRGSGYGREYNPSSYRGGAAQSAASGRRDGR